MRKSSQIKALFEGGSDRLTSLKQRTRERSRVLLEVRGALPDALAKAVESAGIEHQRLTLGVVGAAWASRIRYVTAALRQQVGSALGVEIHAVRIKVVQPSPPGEPRR